MSRIEGKVARVITERELVLNVGSSHGVEVGMRFKILYPGGVAVTDPDTGETLGSVELEKTVVRIVSVQERMSVGRTFRTIEIPERGTNFARFTVSALGGDYEPARTEVETLRSGSGFAAKELSEKESVVKTGDPAVQMLPVPQPDEEPEEEY